METLCFLAQENYEMAYRGFDKTAEFTALFEGVAAAKDMPKRDREKAERLAKDAIEYMDNAMMSMQELIGALRKADKKESIYMEETCKKAFISRSQYEAVKELPREERLAILNAIFKYQFERELPDTTGWKQRPRLVVEAAIAQIKEARKKD